MNVISASSQRITCPNYIIVGNVGIGTTNPVQALDVTGSIAVGGVTVIDSSRNITANTVTATSGIFNSNVGIGTTVPLQPLHIDIAGKSRVGGASSILKASISATCSDKLGNIYVGGYINSSGTGTTYYAIPNIDGSAQSVYTIPIAPSTAPSFIVKYNSNGIVSGYSIIASYGFVNGLASDTAGNIYCAGAWNNSSGIEAITNMDGSSQSTYTLPLSGYNQKGFIVIYSVLGIVTGCSSIINATVSQCASICVDTLGNVYVCGSYNCSGSIAISNINGTAQSTYTLPATTLSDGYVIKYNSSGIVSGYSVVNDTGDNGAYSVCTDLNNNVYLCGPYRNSSVNPVLIKNMDGSSQQTATLSLPTTLLIYTAAYVIKYNSAGIVTGVASIDGAYYDVGFNGCTDSLGNFYAIGQYNTNSSVALYNLDKTTQSAFSLPVSSGDCGFIIKYNSNGIVIGATVILQYSSMIYNVVADPYNNVYIVGYYQNNAGTTAISNLDGTTQSTYKLPITNNSITGFVIKYNTAGIVGGVAVINGAGDTRTYAVGTDSSGNIYVGGQYSSTTTVSLANINLTSQLKYTLPTNYNAAFIVKYYNEFSYDTVINSTGYIGIGTTTPLQALDVRGNIAMGGVTVIDVNRKITAPTAIFSSNVGIGTATAISPLHVVGSASNITSTSNLPTSYLPITSNLTAWYNFEGALTDKSGNGNTLTPTGTMRYVVPGKVGGSAIYLANTAGTTVTNYLQTPYTLAAGSAISVSVWVMFTALPGSGLFSNVFQFGTTTVESFELLYSPSVSAGLYVWDSSTTETSSRVTITVNTWYHCVAMRTGNAGTLSLYVNGQLAASTTAGTLPVGTILNIGVSTMASLSARSFAGYIDDFRIYNRVLSPSEILALYNYTNPIPATPYITTPSLSTGLITHLPFDGGLTETSGTVTVAPTLSGSTQANASYVTGKTGTSCLFLNNTMGGNHLCQVDVLPTTAIYALSTITVAFWAMALTTTSSGQGYMFNIGATLNGATAYSGMALLTTASNTVSMYMNTANNAWAIVGAATTMLPGMWYHLAVTYNGANAYLYINGSSTPSISGALTGAIANGAALRLGDILATSYLTQSFAGYLDDFRVYNRVLSAAEILLLYQIPNNQVANTSGLYGQWKFENNLLDSSGNGFNGLIQNTGATYIAGRAGTYALSMSNVSPTASNLWVDIPMGLQQTSVSPFSLSTWVYPYSYPTAASPNAYISSFVLPTGRGAELYYNTTGGLFMNCYDSGGNANTKSVGTISTSQWSHVAMSWGDGSMRAYLNGVQTVNTNTLLPLDTGIYSRLQLGMGNMTGVVSGATSINAPNNSGYGICTDTFGNVYITGGYSYSASRTPLNNLDGTVSPLSLPVGSSWTPAAAYIIKYNASGVVQGYVSIDGDATDNGTSICVDVFGNIYVTGSYTSSVAVPLKNMDGTTVSAYTLPITVGATAYIIKYNVSGVVSGYTVIETGISDELGYGICTDTSGNVYTTGVYRWTSTVSLKNLDGTTVSAYTLPVPAQSKYAIYIIKYNASGVVSGYAVINNPADEFPGGICTDSVGNVYTTGYYSTATAYPLKNLDGVTVSAYTLPISTGSKTAYIIKYNASGVVSGYAVVNGNGLNNGASICTDTYGNVYTTGHYTNTSTIPLKNLDGTTVSAYTLPISTNQAAYIIKYNASGVVSGYAIIDGDSTNDTGYGICTDVYGNVYTTGVYNSTSTITLKNMNDATTSSYTLPSTSGGRKSYIIKYNINGIVQGYFAFGEYYEEGHSICTDSFGNIYTTGHYYTSSTVPLKNLDGITTSSFILPAAQYGATYIIKYTNLALNGAIDDCRLYNHILTQAEVTDLYGNPNSTYLTATTNTAITSVGPSVLKGTLQVTNTISDKGKAIWGARVTGTGDDIPTSICVTKDGGFAVFGTTTSPVLSIVNADGSVSNLSLVLVGVQMGFLVKYTASGVAQWATKMGGQGSTIGGLPNVVTLNDGSLIAVGRVGSNVSFYNADGSQFSKSLSYITATNGTQNFFILKVNILGAIQWVTQAVLDNPQSVISLADGGFVISGYYRQTTPVIYSTDSTSATTTKVAPDSETFIIKFTTNGVLSWWARGVSSTGGSFFYTESYALTQLADGGIIVAGYFYGSVFTAYNGGSTAPGSAFGTTLSIVGSGNMFVVKYSNAGAVLWLTKTSQNIQSFAACATSDGGCVITSQYGNYASIYSAPGTILYSIVPNVGSADSLVVKYNTLGIVQWVSQITNTVLSNRRIISYPTTDGGHILAGILTGGKTATIYNSDGTFTQTLTTTGTNAAYIAKFSSTGMCVWATKINGGLDDRINSVVVTPDNGLIVVGQTTSTQLPLTNADGTTTLYLSGPASGGGTDGFIAKYNDIGSLEQTALQVTAAGFVGIGTSAPVAPLHTIGNVLHMNGNVGIGSTIPTQKLDVSGAIAIGGVTVIDASRNITATTLTSTQVNTLATSVNMLRAAYDTNSDFRLKQNYTVAGNVQYEFWGKNNAVDYNLLTFKAGKVGVATIDPTAYTLVVTGTMGVSGDITALYSDMRLKTDIVPICNAIEKVTKLSAFTYMDNALARSFGFNEVGRRVGLSAQEVQVVLPEAVKLAPFDAERIDGAEVSKSGETYLTVQYEKMVPLLVAALKEETQLQKELEERVTALEGRGAGSGV